MAKEAVKDAGAQVDTGKLKALQATIDKIEKDYGKGTIMKMADQPQWDEHQVIPSGSSPSTTHLESVVIRKEESLKSMVRSPAARPHWQFTPSPRHRSREALRQ